MLDRWYNQFPLKEKKERKKPFPNSEPILLCQVAWIETHEIMTEGSSSRQGGSQCGTIKGWSGLEGTGATPTDFRETITDIEGT